MLKKRFQRDNPVTDSTLITDTKSVEVGIKEDGCIIAVATGGTEHLIKTLSDRMDKPILLWAIHSNNSLVSSMAVFSVLKIFSYFQLKNNWLSLDFQIVPSNPKIYILER